MSSSQPVKASVAADPPAAYPRLAANIALALGLPLGVLLAVLFGTRPGRGQTYQLTIYFALPVYWLIGLGLLFAYVQRRQPLQERPSSRFLLLAMGLSGLIICLSLPHLPLAGHWHAPNPDVNIALLLLIEFSLAAAWLVGRLRYSGAAPRQPSQRGKNVLH